MQLYALKKVVFSVFILATLVIPADILGQSEGADAEKAILVRAVMAESMNGLEPVHEAVIFSIDLRNIICFTEFDPVPKPMIVYHKWFQRGELITQKQLTLKPPRWTSVSSMQLRTTDIGPWQVDIIDEQGRLLKILRFSITE